MKKEPEHEPGSSDDTRLAARLVVEGVVPEKTMRAVLAKQRELIERGRSLSVAQICIRKKWITATEAHLMVNPERPTESLLPGYQLGPMLGEGGMSRVYAASGKDGPVAVKILHPCLRRMEKDVLEFRKEGQLLTSLDHEHIVKGYDCMEHDGLEVLVMELVHGKSVQQHLDEGDQFSEDEALTIILQTAQALVHLHERGLVHRDIKPGNIIIDGENRVKICDLGLAITAGGGGGENTAGTAQYIAPEQATAEKGLDVRSDIYALGVTLYQLVVGKLPFEGETNHETMRQRLLDELHSPELKARNISPHVHYFIQKMMAMDREIRYQSPQELIEDIREQIQGARSLRVQPGADGPRKPPLPKGGVIKRKPGGTGAQRRRRR